MTDGTDEKKRVSAFGATQKEAISKGRKLEEQYAKGLVAKKDSRTLGAFAQEWYERKERAGKADNTLRRYRFELRHRDVFGDFSSLISQTPDQPIGGLVCLEPTLLLVGADGLEPPTPSL
ncbi:MAG: hypothetical protein IVW51_08920 [Thermaceae bacterium]|nr:hypothetical protein [Thermaceae bacterium]